jgi:uncharacterized coiled-coil protein SlyX
MTAGNLALPKTTSASSGVLALDGNPLLHTYSTAITANLFLGRGAGNFTMTGSENVGLGPWTLTTDTTGGGNTALGHLALYSNTTGSNNVAVGTAALDYNFTGTNNVAVGQQALLSSTGSHNLAVGDNAAFFLSTGDWNIDIGNCGDTSESNTIRIGMNGNHSRTFIAGIRGVTTGYADAIPVMIDAAGQLGTVSSSRRVKDDITDMAGASSALMTLRPVTFHYKSDRNPAGRTLQYGLIAEEVADVYPGLVAHSADGEIETVMYQFLPPMLLNEVQKQEHKIQEQERTIDALRADIAAGKADTQSRDEQIRALTAQLAALAERLARLEKK